MFNLMLFAMPSTNLFPSSIPSINSLDVKKSELDQKIVNIGKDIAESFSKSPDANLTILPDPKPFIKTVEVSQSSQENSALVPISSTPSDIQPVTQESGIGPKIGDALVQRVILPKACDSLFQSIGYWRCKENDMECINQWRAGWSATVCHISAPFIYEEIKKKLP